MNTIFIDIDNTLYDFATPLYHELVKIHGRDKVPEVNTWSWGSPMDISTSNNKIFKDVVDIVHSKQLEFKPFKNVSNDIKKLKDLNLKIIINSGRDKKFENVTIEWLKQNNIYFDDLIVSNSKLKYFKNVDFVIDDAPHILDFCIQNKIKATGILYSWNSYFLKFLPLFDNFSKCVNKIISNLTNLKSCVIM